MHIRMDNKITAHNDGWFTQFRFCGLWPWSGVCEFNRSKFDFLGKNGRGGEIRTHDLLYPKQAR